MVDYKQTTLITCVSFAITILGALLWKVTDNGIAGLVFLIGIWITLILFIVTIELSNKAL
jgi:hypothetical protein